MRFQVSNLRFEIRIEKAKERKVRTPKGSEPANGGAHAEIPDSKFQIRKAGSGNRWATTSATENRPATVWLEISD